MRKLTKSQVRSLVSRFRTVGKQGIARTDPTFLALLDEEVRLDMPLGELANPQIAGLVRSWKFQAIPMTIGEITPNHQFNAQGLEGLVSMPMRLSMALLTATKVDLNRMDIFVPPRWSGGKYCSGEDLEEEEEEFDG